MFTCLRLAILVRLTMLVRLTTRRTVDPVRGISLALSTLVLMGLSTGCVVGQSPGPTRSEPFTPPPRQAVSPDLPSLLLATQWVADYREDLTLLDVRPNRSYRTSHIPGAININWKTFSDPQAPYPGNLNPDVAVLSRLLSEMGIESDRAIVIYSNPLDNWGEEGRIFWMLETLGASRVAIMDGGFPAWIEEGRATNDLIPEPTPVRFEPTWHAQRIMGWSEIRDRLADPSLTIVDTRTESEYKGATPYGEVRGGHIPGAQHLYWKDLLDPAGHILSAPQLNVRIQQAGLDPGSEIVLYCTGGVRSGFVYFVLRQLGAMKARNYDGSFWEWSSRRDLPIER